jgi:hypothetical protein
MTDLIEDIYRIVNNFPADFFSNDPYVYRDYINQLISKSTGGKNDWADRQLIVEMREKHPDFLIENITLIVMLDRCFRLSAKKTIGGKTTLYIFQVSIYGFYSAYTRHYQRGVEGYEYDEFHWLDEGRDAFANSAFETIRKYYADIRWLPKAILERPVERLSYGDQIITIGDVLFTDGNY